MVLMGQLLLVASSCKLVGSGISTKRLVLEWISAVQNSKMHHLLLQLPDEHNTL